MKITVFWDVALCSLRRSLPTFQRRLLSSSSVPQTSSRTSETSVNYQTTRRDIPGDGHLQNAKLSLRIFGYIYFNSEPNGSKHNPSLTRSKLLPECNFVSYLHTKILSYEWDVSFDNTNVLLLLSVRTVFDRKHFGCLVTGKDKTKRHVEQTKAARQECA
jgi:hypothetical protein